MRVSISHCHSSNHLAVERRSDKICTSSNCESLPTMCVNVSVGTAHPTSTDRGEGYSAITSDIVRMIIFMREALRLELRCRYLQLPTSTSVIVGGSAMAIC